MLNAENFLTELLYEMGESVNLHFDKANLKRGFYLPNAYVEQEAQQYLARKLVLDIFDRLLNENLPINIKIINDTQKQIHMKQE